MKLSKIKKYEISPNMFGLFFEDINYAADGGLYAELIENRSFESKEGFGNPGNFYTVDDFGYAWSPVSKSANMPTMKYVSGSPLSEKNPHYLRFTATEAGQGFKNKAYDGIFLNEGDEVKVSFYARAIRYEGKFIAAIKKDNDIIAEGSVDCKKVIPFRCFSDLTVEIDDVDGQIAAIKALDKSSRALINEWVKYELTLKANKTVEAGDFVIELDAEGAVDFDFISVMPTNAVAGVFRKDIFDTLKAMNPGFVRFPGGCIVEGISLLNRYQWKNTVGPIEDRTYIPNLWSFSDDGSIKSLDAQRPDSHYGQSFGIGFYEYFLLCEMIGAKPLPVLNMGAACQFRSTQMVDPESAEFDEYVQDALDLIEFANGSTDTKWGALRASMGHPESFNLELLAVGNEQWVTERMDVFTRNDKFEKAIHEAYPEIKILGTAGPAVDMPIADIAWDYYRENTAKNDNFCYAVDEHYYKSPQWMYDNIELYDNYPERPYVFAGEYAAHTPGRDNSMESALAEAAFMTGLEINAGVVKLASYAPLFNRIGHGQWRPDMIWFDATKVYPTPNYYVQSLYTNNTADYTLEFTDEMRALRKDGIYISPCAKNDGSVILKIANVKDNVYTLPLEDENGNALKVKALVSVLEGDGIVPADMPEKSQITEKELSIDGKVELPANSFSVIKMTY